MVESIDQKKKKIGGVLVYYKITDKPVHYSSLHWDFSVIKPKISHLKSPGLDREKLLGDYGLRDCKRMFTLFDKSQLSMKPLCTHLIFG